VGAKLQAEANSSIVLTCLYRSCSQHDMTPVKSHHLLHAVRGNRSHGRCNTVCLQFDGTLCTVDQLPKDTTPHTLCTYTLCTDAGACCHGAASTGNADMTALACTMSASPSNARLPMSNMPTWTPVLLGNCRYLALDCRLSGAEDGLQEEGLRQGT
jgi:hypothetical protein